MPHLERSKNGTLGDHQIPFDLGICFQLSTMMPMFCDYVQLIRVSILISQFFPINIFCFLSFTETREKTCEPIERLDTSFLSNQDEIGTALMRKTCRLIRL